MTRKVMQKVYTREDITNIEMDIWECLDGDEWLGIFDEEGLVKGFLDVTVTYRGETDE